MSTTPRSEQGQSNRKELIFNANDMLVNFFSRWADHLRAMSHAEFLDVLRPIYVTFLNCIESLQASNNILIDVISGTMFVSPLSLVSRLYLCLTSPPDSPVDVTVINDTLFDILASSTELSNILSSKVLSARTEQHTNLELHGFVELFNESWCFVVRCEVLCRRMIVGLRGVVISQVGQSSCSNILSLNF